MLQHLENIFQTAEIETPSREFIKVHSNTSREQCVFLQQMFDRVKPEKTLEVGLAFGISAMAILEKHRELKHTDHSHLIIEPYPWNGIAEHNLEKAGLIQLSQIYYNKSDEVLPKLYYEGKHIQLAYVDTTKVFDTLLTDFYFIDKMLDEGGVIIFDDCGGAWPGVQKLMRFIATLPHYCILAGHGKVASSVKRNIAERLVGFMMSVVPFKDRFYPGYHFKADSALGLNYSCLAFQKTGPDCRQWNWDKPF